jgi:hypothetical protein
MNRNQLRKVWLLVAFLLLLSACANDPIIDTATPAIVTPETTTLETQTPEIQFSDSGTALLSIPSLNGNQIAIRLVKPEGEGPFPVLIGVAGGDGAFVFRSDLATTLRDMGIMTVDFAPQGRGDSEGEDNFHGTIHQDDLKAIVDYLSTLAVVQEDQIGILSYSFGVVLATGALARYSEMPVAFLIDWEGPASPGKDFRRGLENDEAWVQEAIQFMSGYREVELEDFRLHGGSIFDEAYWQERDAARYAEDLSVPYLRVQFAEDHVQGEYKDHMMSIVNAAVAKSGQWTRVNDNPPNITYAKDDLSLYHFHEYEYGESAGFTSSSKTIDEVLLGYIEEMFFEKPYEAE